MLSNFSYAFNAIAPILLTIMLGYYLRYKNYLTRDFFKTLNKFTFHYSFPALMFTNLYSLGSIRDLDLKLAALLMGSIVIITLSSIVFSMLITDVRNRKGVLIQAGFRSNFAVIGLPLAEGMAGAQGAAVAASMQLPVVVYFNFFSVLFLSLFSGNAKFDLKKTVQKIVSNPLIQGLLAGALALCIREFIPRTPDGTLVFSIKTTLPWLYTTLNYIGRIGTPLTLIAMGGQFRFGDISGVKKELIWGVCMRLIFAPIIGFCIIFTVCRCTNFYVLTPTAIAVMISAFSSPIAASSAVMASEMQGDDVLAGQLVVWTSLLSMITVFLLIVLCRSCGWL